MRTTQTAHTGLRKAAILLALLGEEISGRLCAMLPAAEVQSLTQEMAALGSISQDAAQTVLKEFDQLLMTPDYQAQGSAGCAPRLPGKATETAADQVSPDQPGGAAGSDYLQHADPEQLARLIEDEHPQTIAVVLAHLGPRAASRLLTLLPESTRALAVSRLAEMRSLAPGFVETISQVLHRRVGALGGQSRRSFGGVKAAAEVLNLTGHRSSRIVLENVEQENPQLAMAIRNRMFAFQDFLKVVPDGIRELLGQCDKRTIALALHGASAEVRNHFFRCMSNRAVQMLQEDMDLLGPVRTTEAARAQDETIQLARKLEAGGRIALRPESSDDFINS